MISYCRTAAFFLISCVLATTPLSIRMDSAVATQIWLFAVGSLARTSLASSGVSGPIGWPTSRLVGGISMGALPRSLLVLEPLAAVADNVAGAVADVGDTVEVLFSNKPWLVAGPADNEDVRSGLRSSLLRDWLAKASSNGFCVTPSYHSSTAARSFS